MSSSQDESTRSMFTSIVDSAVNARLSFTRGSVPESIGLIQDIEQMARHLEKWLTDHYRVQRSTNSHDEATQEAGLSLVGKSNAEQQRQQQLQEQHSQGSIFPHSPIAPIPPRLPSVSNTQSSFHEQPSSSPVSNSSAAEGGGIGQIYFSRSVSRPGSRSGSESGSTFIPALSTATSITSTTRIIEGAERTSEGPSSSLSSGSGKAYQHHLKAGSEPHDSLAPHSSPAIASGAAIATGHPTSRSYPHEGTGADDDLRRYPHHSHAQPPSSVLGYSGQGGSGGLQPLPEHGDSNMEEPSPSVDGKAGPIVSRQRHTSLPQVLSHQSPNYPHPHHPPAEAPQQQQPLTPTGYSSNPHDSRRPPSPPQYHYLHPSHHTPGASMASTSSTSSTSSSLASYFGLQNASRAQQRQYELPPGTSTSSSSISGGTQPPYSMYYHPEHYRARSRSPPSPYGYPHEGHRHHAPYPHPYPQHSERGPPPHRSMDEWYDGRSSYHQGHPYYYESADRYQPPYPAPRLYTPPHHLQHHPHHHPHQDRRHPTSLPIRHHSSRFPRRMSQPPTVNPGALDPEGRYIPFLNTDLHEQEISDPYVKRLATSDHHHQPLSPPHVPQSKNVGPSKSSAIGNLSSSSSTSTSTSTTTVLNSSSTGSQSTVGGGAGGNGTSLPVRGGPSTVFGGLVTGVSGAPTAAIPGLVFSSRGDNTGSRTQFHAPLEPEVVAKLDDIFFKFLQRICSDLKACDAKGDHIHQPLMAKKMERLEASTEFRPFKFRIQAFTNAFHDSLIQHGLTEDVLPLRKVKLYLWKHRYISRFNEDGKKQKSKGNHVWNIEARKISNVVTVPTSALASGSGLGDAPLSASTTPSVATPSASSAASTPSIKASTATTTTTGFYDLLPPDMDPKEIGPEAISAAGGGLGIIRRPTSPVRWEFREYSSRIAGQVIKYARVGVPYVYSPRIWDAQMSCPAAKFSSPWLPSWLKWHRGELKGIPSAGDESCTILVVAEYVREGEECRLEMSFPLTVCDLSKEVEMIQQQHTPSGVSGEEDAGGYFERSIGGSNGDSAGAVGVSTSASQNGDSLMKIQLEGSFSFQQQQHGREKDGDEEMMITIKEDEDMEEAKEEQHSVEHKHEQTSSYSQNSRSYYSHHPTHNQKLHEYQATATSLRQDKHQREQRQAQQRLQRLQLQEHQHHQLQQEVGEEQKLALFQSTTAPSSAGTTASFHMNPPSSRGSISSSNGSSAYVEEEEESESEQSEDEDESDGGEEGMESIADGVDDEAGKTRKMKTRASTRTSTSSSVSTARHHRKPSRARRSTVLQETNKRRKHD